MTPHPQPPPPPPSHRPSPRLLRLEVKNIKASLILEEDFPHGKGSYSILSSKARVSKGTENWSMLQSVKV